MFEIVSIVLALITLGDVTQIGLFVFVPKVTKVSRGQFHQCFYVRLFRSFFCVQLIATCEWQPAHPVKLSATCEWHNKHNFGMKKHGEIVFQKQAAFLSFA